MTTWSTIKRGRSRVSAPALLVGGPDENIANIVMEGWRQLSDSSIILPDTHEFRSSLLPYCPILSLLSGNYMQIRFGNDFYFVSGRAQHSLYQHWLPYTEWGKNIWGDWYCLACETHHLRLIHPKYCPQCHSQNIIYVEIEVSLRWQLALLTGHLDLIYKLPNGVIIIDIKTVTERRLNGSKLPYGKHLHQIYSYCHMFEENFKIPVLGFVLAYVPRELDNAGFTGNFVALPSAYFWARAWDNYTRQIATKRLTRALQGRNAELFIRQNGLVVKAVQSLTRNRFCQSYRDYRSWKEANMNRDCPFWNGEICSVTDRKLLSRELTAPAEPANIIFTDFE